MFNVKQVCQQLVSFGDMDQTMDCLVDQQQYVAAGENYYMRIPRYLSPTSVSLFYNDRQEFYLKYLADNRPPRMAQTRPMSIGSAFDAYVKNYLVDKLFGGKEGFDLKQIFEKQVEKQNRDWAWEHGQYVFDCYKQSGAIADLMIELEQASEEPRFEFTVENSVSHEIDLRGVPLLGKPDCYFVTAAGLHIILDWKVNGYCGKRSLSPKPGYIKIRDGWKGDHSRSHRTSHKNAHPMMVDGITINAGKKFEDVDQSWADQVTIYGWLMGSPVGEKLIVGIEQIVAKPDAPNKPKLRIASHRGKVSGEYQVKLFEKIKYVWDTIHKGHIFDEMTVEESNTRCKTLDQYYKAYDGDDPHEKWFANITRGV